MPGWLAIPGDDVTPAGRGYGLALPPCHCSRRRARLGGGGGAGGSGSGSAGARAGGLVALFTRAANATRRRRRRAVPRIASPPRPSSGRVHHALAAWPRARSGSWQRPGTCFPGGPRVPCPGVRFGWLRPTGLSRPEPTPSIFFNCNKFNSICRKNI